MPTNDEYYATPEGQLSYKHANDLCGKEEETSRSVYVLFEDHGTGANLARVVGVFSTRILAEEEKSKREKVLREICKDWEAAFEVQDFVVDTIPDVDNTTTITGFQPATEIVLSDKETP